MAPMVVALILVSDKGDVVPRGLVALCGTWTVSLGGWSQVAAGRAQQCEYGDRGRRGTEGGECGQGTAEGFRSVCRDKADCCPLS